MDYPNQCGSKRTWQNYSQFIHALQRAEIDLDRKALAHIAMEEPEMFENCRPGERATRGLILKISSIFKGQG